MKKDDLTITLTDDGSTTLFSERFNSSYHSSHGAITESMHIFIEHGLRLMDKKEISILELGFGTGLNAILTYSETSSTDVRIKYTTMEAFPIDMDTVSRLNYGLDAQNLAIYHQMHDCDWNKEIDLSPTFRFLKINKDFETDLPGDKYDLVYHDAFGPGSHPEAWTNPFLSHLAASMKDDGILVTFCAQGRFKRELRSVGFKVESPAGPPGKREMTRAILKT